MEDMERIGIPEEDARHKVKLRQIFNPRWQLLGGARRRRRRRMYFLCNISR